MKKNDIVQQAFFALLKAGLWEQNVQLVPLGEIDFNAVFHLAEEQSVVGLIAAGLEHVEDRKPAKKDVIQFVGQALQLEQQNAAMNCFIGVLVAKMRAEGIYTLLVKGQGIAQCYERPLWRSCGDVDFFFSEDNYEKAKRYLTPLAVSVEKEGEEKKHLGMTIDPWVVELHGTLNSGLSSRVDKGLDAIKNDVFYRGNVRTWQNGATQVFLLNANDDAIYVFTHILQHFYKGGVGVRQVCDWCRLLWTYREDIEHKLLESRLKTMGLVSEWKAFGAFAVEYLGMPVEAMPLLNKSYNDNEWRRRGHLRRKVDKICSFILEVGNFGHNRDFSYYQKYPFLVRKSISLCQRIGDLSRHALVFPLDSLRFFPKIFFNGLRSAFRGE